MSRNVEIKAFVEDPERLYTLATGIATGAPHELHQIDTFYTCDKGRLKLREINSEKTELIFYSRPDTKDAKLSDYVVTPVVDTRSMTELLDRIFSKRGVVEKTRTLIMSGQTRIHLDSVKQLGSYMELEVVLTDNQSIEEGQKIAKALMEQLEIHPQHLISKAYIDILEEKGIVG